MKLQLGPCDCGSGKEREAVFDMGGNFMMFTCFDCRERKLGRMRPAYRARMRQDDDDE